MIRPDEFAPTGDGHAWWTPPWTQASAPPIANLDRPCETCDGTRIWRDQDRPGVDIPCGDCIDGRHTLDIEVGPSDIRAPHVTVYNAVIPYRVSIVPGMVLQIREWQGCLDPPTGRWLALNPECGRYSVQECDGYGITTYPSNIDLPATAAVGGWVVKVKLAA